MYLFCSNPDVVSDVRSLRDFAKPFGKITRFHFAGGCLICIGSPMSRVARTDSGVRVELFLPGQDDESTNTLDWELESGIVRFTRSWRGVFTTFFSDRPPFIVTSHKKLAVLFVRKPSPLKTLAAGSTGTFYLTKQENPRIQPPPPIQRFDAFLKSFIRSHRVAGAKQRYPRGPLPLSEWNSTSPEWRHRQHRHRGRRAKTRGLSPNVYLRSA